jgi:hypothetical protein
MLVAGQATFTGPIALIGTLAVPILGGVFPMLMLYAARRRGEYVPEDAPGWLGHPVTVVAVASLFGVGVLVQGTIIWQEPAGRVAAILVALLMIGLAVQAARSGAFTPRTVVEIRWGGRGDRVRYGVVSAGHAVPTAVAVATADGELQLRRSAGGLDAGDIRAITFALPPPRALTVWSHRVNDEGDSIPELVSVSTVADAAELAGTIDLGTTDADGRLTVTLPTDVAGITVGRQTEPAPPRTAQSTRRSIPNSPAALVAGGKVTS